MEKKRLTGKDILRMDGLLPPTRRLSVCDAVSTSTEKKKDKKWSIDNLLKRFSLIRDYESSSNEEEIVYCKKEPKRPIDLSKKTVVLKPIRSSNHRQKEQNIKTQENSIHRSAESLCVNRDSINSRSSDGSFDGSLSRKVRRSKVKARVEAQRDRLCVNSSSDEDSRKSSNSLTRTQTEESSQNSQKSNSGHKKTRAARTERYIKRLSRDEGSGSGDIVIHNTNNRKTMDQESHTRLINQDGQYRPPIHPRRLGIPSNEFHTPVKRSSVDCIRDPDLGIPDTSSLNNFTRRSSCQYVTDFNQNNAYKMTVANSNESHYGKVKQINHSVSLTPVYTYYSEFYEPVNNLPKHSSNSSVPSSRNTRHCPVAYESTSCSFNSKHQVCNQNGYAKPQIIEARLTCRNFRPYSSNNEITNCGVVQEPRRPMSLNSDLTQLYDSEEYLNNKYTSFPRSKIDSSRGIRRSCDNLEAIEATKCQKRNTRNEQLNFSDPFHGGVRNKLTEDSNEDPPVASHHPKYSLDQYARHSPERSSTKQYSIKPNEKMREEEEQIEIKIDNKLTEEEAAERKRNSKNLEEALTELEAIYNSLRLGDEDLLDRAERRSMEEFSMKRSKRESEWVSTNDQDSPDRTKDDMAYRRMHPKERPASLSEIMEQSSLSNISYLIASPILSRKNPYEKCTYVSSKSSRRDEPDVTRDDVVFRSINHANNTLKVLDPQPPFGIPLGPVTAATESDYLHTTPRKPDQPRSLYIPQVEPDVVTDDLAFRALRKDANGGKKPEENKIETESNETKSPEKKRAVRSLSANLYGLINHNSIQLHKQSSLKRLNGESNSQVEADQAHPSNSSDHFRRVVSDGELSDHDLHWHFGKTRTDIDINGNHSCQKKLRVYVSPVTTMRKSETDPKKNVERTDPSFDARLIESLKERWDLRSDCDDAINNKNLDPDFTEYSRRCQDLVDSIETPGENQESIKDSSLQKQSKDSRLERSTKSLTLNQSNANRIDKEEVKSVLCISSLDRHCASLNVANAQNKTSTSASDDLEEALNLNLDVLGTEKNQLNYYLRLADENVKLIAEAFSSVADHIQDSEVGNKRTPNSSLVSDLDNVAFDRITGIDAEEKEEENFECLLNEVSASGSEDQMTIFTGDQSSDQDNYKGDPDLSKAVHDLEIAAANLRESVKKTEEELQSCFAKHPVKSPVTKEHSDDVKETEDEERPEDQKSGPSTSLEIHEGENKECEFNGPTRGISSLQGHSSYETSC